jgi:hypothetical protein
MAIQVSGTTVIDNSRILQNIAGINGVYDNLQPDVSAIGTVIDFNTPMMTKTLSSNTTFSESNKATGHSAILLLDTTTSNYDPTFSSNVKFPTDGTVPTWDDHRYWVISFVCFDGTTVRAAAVGYDN